MIKRFKNGSNTGKMMILIGLIVFVPLLIIPFNKESGQYTMAFVWSGLISIVCGLLVCFIFKSPAYDQNHRRRFSNNSKLLVIFVWIWGIFIDSLPFIFAKICSPLLSVFESVSGLATCGLTILDLNYVDKIFMFHRAWMQYVGGLGFIFVFVLIAPNIQSMDIFQAEGHSDQLGANIRKTSKIILMMYGCFLALGILAYVIAGLPFFDAMCHTMSALSTGGFSTHNLNIGGFNNFAAEMITVALMLIGTTNFFALLLLLNKKVKQFFRISEIRFMGIILLATIPAVALLIARDLSVSFLEGLRHSSLEVVSSLSTAGFTTVDYTLLSPTVVFIITIIMIMGGGMGSTSGGIKLTRVYLLIRNAFQTIKSKVKNERNVEVLYYHRPQGKTRITDPMINETLSFTSWYMILLFLGTLILTISADCSLTEAMFEFASTLSGVGLTIGITSPFANPVTLITLMAGMFLGRLDILIVLQGIEIIKNKVTGK